MKIMINKMALCVFAIYFMSSSALASCVTGFACSDSSTCTVTTICNSFQTNLLQNNMIIEQPRNSYGGPGIGYVPPAAKALSITSCRNGFSTARVNKCKEKVLDTHASNIATCNTGLTNSAISRDIASSGIAGGFATIKLGGPFAFGIVLVSTYIYVRDGADMTYFSGECKDTANSLKDKDTIACETAPAGELAALAQACK